MSGQIPFPSHLLPSNASDEHRRKAIELWSHLNQLAQADPSGYRRTIEHAAQELREAASHKDVGKYPVTIKHRFTLRVTVAGSATAAAAEADDADLRDEVRYYINVLESDRIKPMGDEDAMDVPMVVSRDRPVDPGKAEMAERASSATAKGKQKASLTKSANPSALTHVSDVVLHPSTLDRAHADGMFRRDLQDLIVRSVQESHEVPLSTHDMKQLPDYKGPWLWTAEGAQKTDAELKIDGDLTLEKMLHRMHMKSQSEEDKEGKGAHDGGLGSAGPLIVPRESTEPIPAKDAPRSLEESKRVDSKGPLIEELGAGLQGSQENLPARQRIIEQPSPAVELPPTTAAPSRVTAGAPVTQRLVPRRPSATLSMPRPNIEEELDAATRSFLEACPPHSMRSTYLPVPMNPLQKLVKFELPRQIPNWDYRAELHEADNVLEFLPLPTSPRLPPLSVRFHMHGGELRIGAAAVHDQRAWAGTLRVVDPLVRYSRRTRTLTVATTPPA